MGDPRLSATAIQFIKDESNTVFVSAATAWEIAIKYQLGKLELPESPDRFVPSRIVTNNMEPIAITVEHGLRTNGLPLLHKDPFDRILIAQSLVVPMPIITNDPMIAQYGVDVIW
jgi:PIN domain nuclease of toxin-antitoxin system